jgi:hypothetical protein
VKTPTRLVVAGTLSALILGFAAAFAVAGPGGGSSSATQTGKKQTICHKGKNTITVSVHALPAHKAHGDTVGPCAGTTTPTAATTTTPTTTTTTTPSHGNGHGNGKGKGK